MDGAPDARRGVVAGAPAGRPAGAVASKPDGDPRAVRLYVSPNGNDAGRGTIDSPLRTLDRARDLVRASPARGKRPIEVLLRAGRYDCREPFALTERDSGAPGAPVIYRAAPGEDVWLDGGMPIPLARFERVRDAAVLARLADGARRHVRAFRFTTEQARTFAPPLPDSWWIERRDERINELFVGGTRLPMARWPNEGYTTFGRIVEPAENEGETPAFEYRGDRPARWDTRAGVWLYGFWRRGYRAEFIKVKSIDTAAKTIRLAGRNSLGPLETGGARRYCAIHVFEELDAPGEWYLDRATRTLYLLPLEAPEADAVTFSVNPGAVIHCKGVKHVEFRRLGIEHSARDGIRIERGSACGVLACEVRNCAFTGIHVDGNRNRVVGCDVHHTGNVAIAMKSGDRYELTPGDSLIDDCHIHHANRIVRAGSRAVSIDGLGIRFSHNLVHDVGYIAVRYAGNDIVMEYNRLFRTNTESTEGGVFYTGRDWTCRGNTVRYNFVHHVEDSREGCGSATRFLHLDDSAPGNHVYGNVCYRMGGGVSICGGAANDVHDNLFVECHWGVDIGPRGADMFLSDGKGGYRKNPNHTGWDSLEKRLRRYKWNQPPYSTRYPKLIAMFGKDPIAAPWFNVVKRNVMVDCGQGIRSGAMKPEWSTVRDNWEGSDPGFVNADRTKMDFALRPDAVVREAVSFEPGRAAQAGLYESPDRRTWPVPLDLPAPDWKPRWMRLRDAAVSSLGNRPIYRAVAVTGKLVIDGRTSAMEWTPGDATGRAPDVHQTANLKWTAAKKPASRPCHAMLQTDEKNLYVQFHVQVNPEVGASRGNAWGKDDAVEIALAEAGDELGPIMVLRGYANGRWQTTDESGAPDDVRRRLTRGDVKYAAHVASRALWTAEWRIPFAALGLAPRTRNPRLAFNLSVRNVGDDEWVMLKDSGGYTWDVAGGHVLWLAQFGDAATENIVPSVAEVHVISATKTPGMLEAARGCDTPGWAKPAGYRLVARRDNLSTDAWDEFSFSFVARSGGECLLVLMGASASGSGADEGPPVWVYFDAVSVDGARLLNGDFEQRAANGDAVAWGAHVKPGLTVHDGDLAASGEWLAKVAFRNRLAQKLALTAGRTVTVRAKVRGLAVKKSE